MGGGGDALVDRQIRQKGFHLRRSHVTEMAYVVKEHKATHPVDAGLFRAFGILQGPQEVADLLKQFFLSRRGMKLKEGAFERV